MYTFRFKPLVLNRVRNQSETFCWNRWRSVSGYPATGRHETCISCLSTHGRLTARPRMRHMHDMHDKQESMPPSAADRAPNVAAGRRSESWLQKYDLVGLTEVKDTQNKVIQVILVIVQFQSTYSTRCIAIATGSPHQHTVGP